MSFVSPVGATRVSLNYETYFGGRFVGCGLNLHYIPSSELEVVCSVNFPENHNRISQAVCQMIEKTAGENSLVGKFILEAIDFHEINSSQKSFENAARQATLSIVGLLRG